MKLRLVYRGPAASVFFLETANGRCQPDDLIESLPEKQQMHVLSLLGQAGDRGHLKNDQKMKHVAGDIWEFKSHQVRLFYFRDTQGNFVITNGYLKKRMKLDRKEIQQAHRLQREFETGEAS